MKPNTKATLKTTKPIVITCVLGASVVLTSFAGKSSSAQNEKRAIERLHQQDVQATLTDKADELAQLWDRDAVRIQPGSAVEIGKTAIYANDKRWEAKADRRLTTIC